MSDQTPEPGISDEDLPEDLRPTDDNPLAQPLDPDAEETKDQDELDMDATQDDDSAEESSEESGGESAGESSGD